MEVPLAESTSREELILSGVGPVTTGGTGNPVTGDLGTDHDIVQFAGLPALSCWRQPSRGVSSRPCVWSGLCMEQRFIGGSRIHQATGSL
jgi:hypothetical protein